MRVIVFLEGPQRGTDSCIVCVHVRVCACVCWQRLAQLLAQGTKKGLGAKVLLSGLSAQKPVKPAAVATAAATSPLARGTSNSASTHARRVRGSNALLNILTGHIGVPNTTPHQNTLFFHASTTPPVAAVSRTPVTVARTRTRAAAGGAPREQSQKSFKQQAESWFWPFTTAPETVTHTLAGVPHPMASAARARKEAVARGRAALAAAATAGASLQPAQAGGVKTHPDSWSLPEFQLGNVRFGM
jgi:hypothetical protein